MSVIGRKGARQLLSFGVVGVLNTLSDFVIFNILFAAFKFPLLLANICAVTLVMSVSLQLNRRFVFGATNKSYASHILKFVLVTIVGLYVIQNVILFMTLGVLQSMSSLSGFFANDLVQTNVAKAVGVGGSAVWDFVLYKLWVFRTQPDQSTEVFEPEE